MSEIASLAADVENIAAELTQVQTRLHEAKNKFRDAHLASRGVAIGATVRAKGGGLFRIAKAEIWSFREESAISLHGHPMRKDGSFGLQVRYLGTHWEPVAAETASRRP